MTPGAPASVGVLLSAGRARRMGTPKQLLEIPGAHGGRTTMVARAFDLLAAEAPAMVVVVAHEADAVVHALGTRKFDVVRSDADADMLHSVRLGLVHALEHHAGAAACWLHPVDLPFVRPGTLAQLRHVAQRWYPDRAIMPVHAGRGGHPALIPMSLARAIMTWSGTGGLRSFWLERPERCIRLGVDDPGVVEDLDTPEEYRAALARHAGQG